MSSSCCFKQHVLKNSPNIFFSVLILKSFDPFTILSNSWIGASKAENYIKLEYISLHKFSREPFLWFFLKFFSTSFFYWSKKFCQLFFHIVFFVVCFCIYALSHNCFVLLWSWINVSNIPYPIKTHNAKI